MLHPGTPGPSKHKGGALQPETYDKLVANPESRIGNHELGITTPYSPTPGFYAWRLYIHAPLQKIFRIFGKPVILPELRAYLKRGYWKRGFLLPSKLWGYLERGNLGKFYRGRY